jgi:divinyl protochlorophyllide a 8-vinyl-reductase
MEIACCPICRGARADDPICDYYAATFEHLFRALIHPRIEVRETQCQAQGASACVFEASVPSATGSSWTTG